MRSVGKKYALTLLVWKRYAMARVMRITPCHDILRQEDMRSVCRKYALTLLVRKSYAVAPTIRSTFALSLCVRKMRATS